jgi:tRNA pseudouridine55 synthase
LAADLGRLLGGGAHLRNLRRTAVGSFTEAEAHGLDDLALLEPAVALRDYQRVDVDEGTATLVRNGRILDAFGGSGPWALCDPNGELLAVYEAHDRGAKPAVVLTSS